MLTTFAELALTFNIFLDTKFFPTINPAPLSPAQESPATCSEQNKSSALQVFKKSLYILTIQFHEEGCIGIHAPQRSRDFSRQRFCKHYIWHRFFVIDVGVGYFCFGLMGKCGSREAHVRRECMKKKNTIPGEYIEKYHTLGL